MRRLLLTVLFLTLAILSARAQFQYKWSIGGTMGMGSTMSREGDALTMSATVGFNRVIRDTKWRWGIEGGLMNQGLVDYFLEDDGIDRFVRSDFAYAGVSTDYCIASKNTVTIFARSGLAAAQQSDMWLYHHENKFTAIGFIGAGLDCELSKILASMYFTPGGVYVITISYGWWFGKRNRDPVNQKN